MDLRGNTAVITGASRGLGAGLAAELALRGMRLALCARSGCELPDGATGLAARVDVADEAAMRAFAKQAEHELGVIDLWINNAGVIEPVAPLRDIAPPMFLEHLRINVMGVVHGCQAFIAHVRGHARAAGSEGVLINISSGAAWRGYAGWGPYCAGKAAVERISETIQVEEADYLRVYAVAPGVIDTDMQALIRSLPEERFPSVGRFRQMKAQGAFNSIPYVARQLLDIAFDPAARPEQVTVSLPPEQR